MNSEAVIRLAVKASLELLVLGVGLNAQPNDAAHLLRQPGLFVRSVVSMNVIMPLLALWLAIVFDLRPPVKLALFCTMLSPVPPFLPAKVTYSGGHQSYIVSLLTLTSLLAIVVVPLSVAVLGMLFRSSFHIPATTIARIVATGVLAPLVAGFVLRRLFPRSATRLSKLANVIAILLLIAAMIPVLVTLWPSFQTLAGNGTLIAMLIVALIGTLVGHWMGGPVPSDRTVLALATASRHPAIAIAVGAAIMPNEKLVGPAVLMNLIVGSLGTAPYSRRGRAQRDSVRI
jgi:BASS family bile acid:Na+ symporter